MTSVVLFNAPRRTTWYRGFDGVLTKTKRRDEILDEVFDFEEFLKTSGNTISSDAWVDVDGVTLSNESNTTLRSLVTVTGCGYATLKLTLSSGEEIHTRFRWKCIDGRTRDYNE